MGCRDGDLREAAEAGRNCQAVAGRRLPECEDHSPDAWRGILCVQSPASIDVSGSCLTARVRDSLVIGFRDARIVLMEFISDGVVQPNLSSAASATVLSNEQ